FATRRSALPRSVWWKPAGEPRPFGTRTWIGNSTAAESRSPSVTFFAAANASRSASRPFPALSQSVTSPFSGRLGNRTIFTPRLALPEFGRPGQQTECLPDHQSHRPFKVEKAPTGFGQQTCFAILAGAACPSRGLTLVSGEPIGSRSCAVPCPGGTGMALLCCCPWCGKPRRHLYLLSLVETKLVDYLGLRCQVCAGFRFESQGQMSIDATDMMKTRRRVRSPEPEYRFCFPTAVDFDPETDRIIVADSQPNRLQIYRRVRGYAAFQANL